MADLEKMKSLVPGPLITLTASISGGHVQAALDPAVVKSCVRKCDLILLPMLAISYMLNSLDRSNLGNAETSGLSKDIGLTGNQYNLVLTIYYVALVIFGPVGSVVTKCLSGKYGLPIMMLGFGTASICTAAVKSFSGLFACRLIVGVFEAGFVASVVVYLSGFYTRRQIASRIGIFYAANVTASAFGGLLAYGIFHINNGKLYPWAYLYLVEGSLTLLVAAVAFFVLPRNLQTTYFLTQAEKEAGTALQLMDSVSEVTTVFSWAEALSEFRTWHVYVRMIIAFTFGVLLNSNANFLAIMTQRLGYDVVKTNLYTVAPAVTSAIILLLISFSSDYFQERGFHMVGALTSSVVGYIILMTVDVATQRGLAYFAIFLCTIGAYPMSVIFSAWTVSNINNLNARASTMGILLSIANAAGLLSSNIFYKQEAPRSMTALKCNLICAAICMLVCGSYSTWMRLENRRRDHLSRESSGTDSTQTEYATAGVEGTEDIRFRFQP